MRDYPMGTTIEGGKFETRIFHDADSSGVA
jgi:hypothetical protein